MLLRRLGKTGDGVFSDRLRTRARIVWFLGPVPHSSGMGMAAAKADLRDPLMTLESGVRFAFDRVAGIKAGPGNKTWPILAANVARSFPSAFNACGDCWPVMDTPLMPKRGRRSSSTTRAATDVS